MGRTLATIAAVAVAVAGCGGGGAAKRDDTQPRRSLATLTAWTDAARAFGQEFRSCGTRAYPTRDFHAACMKPTLADYGKAAAALHREIAGAMCQKTATQIDPLVTEVTSLVHQDVRVSDAALNAYLDHRRYRGPPFAIFDERAQRIIARDVAQVRKLSASLFTGCSTTGA